MNNKTQDLIIKRLQNLQPTTLQVIDEGDKHIGHAITFEKPSLGHFKVIIESPLFKGKTMIDCHKMVYESLGELMSSHIHALALQTKAPQ